MKKVVSLLGLVAGVALAPGMSSGPHSGLAGSVSAQGAPPSASSSTRTPRSMAVTFDDLPGVSNGSGDVDTFERFTRDLVQAITRRGVRAVGFVNEGKLERDGQVDERRVALLTQWLDAGLELGNHTYAHRSLHEMPLQEYEDGVVRGEVVTRRLMEGRFADGRSTDGRRNGRSAATAMLPARPRYFRHPFLHTGRTPEIRTAFEAFLAERGYRVAPVSIDNSDYVFAAAYDRALASGDAAGAARIASTYLAYMQDVVAYYERQSTQLFGREIRQVLLLHANALNAKTFDDLAGLLQARGYGFVTLDDALADPAYRSRDEFFGSGGISWIHRWALTEKKDKSFFAGEPEVPDWIAKGAQATPAPQPAPIITKP